MWRTDSLEKTLMLGKVEGRRRRGTREDEMVGWLLWLDGHEFEQALGVGGGQGILVCCSPRVHKELDTTEQLNCQYYNCSYDSILFLNSFIYFIWRLITLQYCNGFCLTLTWISHGCTCVPHLEPTSHLLPHPIPQGHQVSKQRVYMFNKHQLGDWTLFFHLHCTPSFPEWDPENAVSYKFSVENFLPSIFPRIRVFSNESVVHIRWPKYWSFSFNISPSNEHSGLISFRMDWLDLLAVQGTLKSLLQHHGSKASFLWRSAFFIVQLSHPYLTIGKTRALTRCTFVGKVMSLLFNMLSMLVITFLPRSKHLLISWLQSPSAVILEPRKIKSATVSTVSPLMRPDAMILFFWMLSSKPTCSLSSFTFIKRLFNSSSLSAIRVVSICISEVFFGIGMKTDLFQSCGNCWVFQICWHIECSTFTASFFRIW